MLFAAPVPKTPLSHVARRLLPYRPAPRSTTTTTAAHMSTAAHRIESDTMGKIKVPADRSYNFV